MPSDIEQIVKYGIRSYHPKAWNLAIMPAYGTAQPSARDAKMPPLTPGGKLAAGGIVLTAVVLLGASALGRDLGLPTFVAGTVVTAIVLVIGRRSPMPVLKDVSWSVLPLVAGLFILVEGMNRTGVLPSLAHILKVAAAASPHLTSWIAGVGVAIASNLINNLPMGLIAATTSQTAFTVSPRANAMTAQAIAPITAMMPKTIRCPTVMGVRSMIATGGKSSSVRM